MSPVGINGLRRHADGIGLFLRLIAILISIEAIGNDALRLSFLDRHDRGIYPWLYLRELADQAPD